MMRAVIDGRISHAHQWPVPFGNRYSSGKATSRKGTMNTASALVSGSTRSSPISAVLGVGEVEAGAGVPFGALVAVGGDAAGVLEHARHVQEVPGGEGGVAAGEVVLGSAGALVEVGGAGAGGADPAGVGLRRDGVAEVLEG